jgi:Zn-dependent M28 family amino/carboxypeptidase
MLINAMFILALLLRVQGGTADDAVTPEDLRRHIEILAADDYGGRQPGSAGAERTEAYLINAFATAGLKPGASGGTWRQTIRMVERKPLRQPKVEWTRRGRGIPVPRDGVAVLGRDQRLVLRHAPLVFVGYGSGPDIQGVDLRGTVVLRLSDAAPPGRTKLRSEAFRAKGAVGIIGIEADEIDWNERKLVWLRRASLFMADTSISLEGIMSAPAAATLFRESGFDLTTLRAAARESSFRGHRLKVDLSVETQNVLRTFETANIIGEVPGRTHHQEAVVLLAHWDHLGACRPEGEADRICNGAADNASGTAALIEVAKRLIAGPQPRRSVYILATTAEEMGHRGAAAFADSPPERIGSIIAALNLDTPAVGPAGLSFAIVGRRLHPELDEVIDRTIESLGRAVDRDTEADVMLTRQDGWAFIEREIPAVMITRSASDMALLGNYLKSLHHRPNDDVSNLGDLSGAAEDANINLAIIRTLADPERFPSRPNTR